MTVEERFWSKVRRLDDPNKCWEWIGKSVTEFGYGSIRYNGRSIGAHRLSWILSNGEIGDSKIFVCHKCDNPKCVNPNHLFLGTNSDNMKDAFRKNRIVVPEGVKFVKGSEPPNKSLSNEKMLEVIQAIQDRGSKSIACICRELDVSYQAVRDMRRKSKRSFKDLTTS